MPTETFAQLVRPWYRGEVGDHIYADCPEIDGQPVEGVGRLDPRGTDVCEQCLTRWDVRDDD